MQDNLPWQFWVPVATILWLVLLYLVLQNRHRIKQIESRPTSLSIFNKTAQRWEEVQPQTIFDQDAPEMAQQPVAVRVKPRIRTADDLPEPPSNKEA